MRPIARMWGFAISLAALNLAAATQPRELSAQDAPPCRPAPPPGPGWELQTYFPCQVTTPAVFPRDRSKPEYPNMLERAGVEGRVELLAVIDRTGKIDTASIKTLKSTHELFTAAARVAMLAWTAKPALLDTVSVREVVHHGFVFIPPGHECITAPGYASQDVTVVCATHEKP